MSHFHLQQHWIVPKLTFFEASQHDLLLVLRFVTLFR